MTTQTNALTTTQTLAQRYNAEAQRLMPQMGQDLLVDPAITDAGVIDDIVFRRSEFLGGMAVVILALVETRA